LSLARRHKRMPLTAELTIQLGDGQPVRTAANVYNVSKGGLAVFSERAFPAGMLVGLDISLPTADGGARTVCLFGATRWCQPEQDGHLLGIELLTDPRAGDYRLFCQYLAGKGARLRHEGFTLVELSVAMVIICLLMTMAAPNFRLAIEEARANAASANLRAIWSAQRAYWLEHRTFSDSLTALQSLDLIDAAVAESATNPKAVYVYQIVAADAGAFSARALRNSSGVWVGQIEIDEEGRVTGAIQGTGGQQIVIDE